MGYSHDISHLIPIREEGFSHVPVSPVRGDMVKFSHMRGSLRASYSILI